jgi:hypothetical protein
LTLGSFSLYSFLCVKASISFSFLAYQLSVLVLSLNWKLFNFTLSDVGWLVVTVKVVTVTVDWQRLSDLLCLNRPKKVGQGKEGLMQESDVIFP